MEGLFSFAVFFVSFVGIYAILTLGLNVQWGFTGLFNIGIAGFFAMGAYTSAILTTAPTPDHLGGFDLPIIVGVAAAIVTSGLLALLIGLITLNLREDYLAIATIGLAEIVRLFFKNEEWLANGPRGVFAIPQPFRELGTLASSVAFLIVVIVAVAAVYVLIERARRAPWGRVVRAIREQEDAALAAGKNVVRFRLQAFVFGSAIMGLGGALLAHFFGFISPETFDPMNATFLVWVMLIVGGSGNNKGAIVGAFAVWGIFTFSERLMRGLPIEYVTQASALRVVLIGVLLIAVLLWRADGLLPESRNVGRETKRDGDSA